MSFNHEELLQTGMRMYGLDPGDLLRHHDSEHSIIASYKKGDSGVFLRLTRAAHRSTDFILGEIDWIEFLSSKGLRVSRPVRSAQGQLVEEIRVDEEKYTAVCFEAARGRRITEVDYNVRLFRHMGAYMGKMHKATKYYEQTSINFKRADWSAEVDLIANIELPESERSIVDRYTDLRGYISTLSKSWDNYGLIHADFHHGNFCMEGDSICLYDFDACRYSWFADDIAIAVFFATALDPKDVERKKFIDGFLEGYSLEHVLEKSWLDEIPNFIALREIGRYIKLYHASDGRFEQLHPWGRAFMQNRKERILRT
ncbi:Ser/Thr protein kinase RdoA (MazF antagonist) [Paenibacillus phyllosphaerae]|uniref:Ser/Thr protein kinase RdoA (MazF antagonist) n=1 Tax=Paenibacillus phyllosphaerae TaxID=274593 RepID=A0A7W5FQ64_9BACL|nr:phosphotransferase [Paenibacillus phyllosphaerae]MBB3112709.1 Ser/Thr protein kinase RdoA (MazF antagonist) [Paenibacillus phyllosphaerae]